ncbi:hypothetical protein GGR52DRAFT_314846 [Hypoxylon sp. FL1284]|nr:hypothetical protein GGR52DRAFT_314846 [Hypoxylon sp. FL1284]
MGDANNYEASLARETIRYAREHSYYYRNLYKLIQDDDPSLEDLPITDLDDYSRTAKADLANILTAPLAEGRVYCTGGSTESVNISHLTVAEVHSHSKAKALIWGAILDLVEGDRVASLATPGELDVGFWDTVNMYTGIMVPVQSIQVLVSNEQPLGGVAAAVERFRPSVLIGSIPDLTRLIGHFDASNTTLLSVRAIVYLGYSAPQTLSSSWRAVFPKAKLFPLLYSKLDLGLLGIPVPITACEAGNVASTYSVAHEVAILEIVADDGTVIKQPGVRGNVVVTHLMRRLQPVVRFPVGDVAEWVDYESRTFKYHGPASTKIQLATSTLDFSLVKGVVDGALGTDVRGRFQCVLCREGSRSKPILRLAYPMPHNSGQLRHNIESAIWRASPDWKRDRLAGTILSLRMEWVDADQLDYDGSSGKLKEVIDER